MFEEKKLFVDQRLHNSNLPIKFLNIPSGDTIERKIGSELVEKISVRRWDDVKSGIFGHYGEYEYVKVVVEFSDQLQKSLSDFSNDKPELRVALQEALEIFSLAESEISTLDQLDELRDTRIRDMADALVQLQKIYYVQVVDGKYHFMRCLLKYPTSYIDFDALVEDALGERMSNLMNDENLDDLFGLARDIDSKNELQHWLLKSIESNK